MPLDITRSFVQNHDGTYVLFVPQEPDGSNSFRRTGNNPLIKPSELKTYLRVGKSTMESFVGIRRFLGNLITRWCYFCFGPNSAEIVFWILLLGNTSPDQKEPTPFIIEWIPDILPVMKIGELRINFEYGHQRNGQLDVRSVPSNQETQFVQLDDI